MTNEKKEKLKDSIFIWCVTLIIAIITITTAILYNKDATNINISNDNKNIAYHLDTNNNLVSDNLIDYDNRIPNSGIDNNSNTIVPNSGTFAIDYFSVVPSTTYSYNFANIPRTYVFFYDNNKNIISYGLASDGSFITPNNCYYLRLQMNDSINRPMLNKGSIALSYEPFGAIWYENHNINYYYFNNKVLSLYGANNDIFYTNTTLIQTDYSSYTLDLTNLIESVTDYDSIKYFRAEIPINLLSKDFFINAIYPVSTIEGEFKIYYSDNTSYIVTSNDINNTFHIYNGEYINPSKIVSKISLLFHYDTLLSIDFTTSPSMIMYNNGYNDGYNQGNTDGVLQGRQTGYNQGYQVGYNEGANTDLQSNGMKVLFNSILSFPINFISQSLNFEFMGINVASIVLFLCSVGIVLFVVKRLWK